MTLRILVSACLIEVTLAAPLCAQQIDQLTRPVAVVEDDALIASFLEELFIPATDDIWRIDVVDLTGNGWGPDDALILYPSLETYFTHGDVPRVLQRVMKTWELAHDYRLDATVEDSRRVQADAHRSQNARDALSGAVLGAIAHYYTGDEIDLRLSREASGLRLEMWNYDPEALRYSVPLQGPVCTAASAVAPIVESTFRFAKPHFVTSFRDAGDCVVSRLNDGRIETSPC